MKNHPITGTTTLVGLIGWPVEHSLSPIMHNAAFAALECDFAYVPLPVQPQHVKEALKGLAALNFVGSNVTIPHKQAVMRYMDELSEAARFTGALFTCKRGDFTVITPMRSALSTRSKRPIVTRAGCGWQCWGPAGRPGPSSTPWLAQEPIP